MAQCQRAEVVHSLIDYIGKGPLARTDSVYRPRAVTSSVVVDLRSLTDARKRAFWASQVSDICHEVVDQGAVGGAGGSPEKT